MTGQQAADIIHHALTTAQHAQVQSIGVTGDGLDITFTDGSVAVVAITVMPTPEMTP